MSAAPGDDCIAAVATPPGRGAIGIVRLSGGAVPALGAAILGALPVPRRAALRDFLERDGTPIDRGLALYFPAPHSYTGEHALELHGHGSPVALNMVLRRCLELGARLARPGEFSERAFLNGRLDLTQAEAVADLIESSTEAAARSAMRSLRGEFSARIRRLVDDLTAVRAALEAGLDFPDEDAVEALAEQRVDDQLSALQSRFEALSAAAERGKLLRDGLKVVLTGPPNAGKSSLFNALAQHPRAIVSAIPGTTRDVLEHWLELDGVAVELVDSAGLREAADEIEIEGVRRAREAQRGADLILLVVDDAATAPAEIAAMHRHASADRCAPPVCLVRNKIDLSGRRPGVVDSAAPDSPVAGSITPDSPVIAAPPDAVAGSITPDSPVADGVTPKSLAAGNVMPDSPVVAAPPDAVADRITLDSPVAGSATPKSLAAGNVMPDSPVVAAPPDAVAGSITPDSPVAAPADTFAASVALSAQSGAGLAALRALIGQRAGFRGADDSGFIARQRHLEALQRARQHLDAGRAHYHRHRAAEILAEELSACQRALGEITGEVASDDLLGHIFAKFCIGK